MSGDGGRPDGRRRRRGPLAAADDADPGDVVDDSAWLPSPRAKRRVANRVVVSWAAEQPDQQLALINAGVTGTVCWGCLGSLNVPPCALRPPPSALHWDGDARRGRAAQGYRRPDAAARAPEQAADHLAAAGGAQRRREGTPQCAANVSWLGWAQVALRPTCSGAPSPRRQRIRSWCCQPSRERKRLRWIWPRGTPWPPHSSRR